MKNWEVRGERRRLWKGAGSGKMKWKRSMGENVDLIDYGISGDDYVDGLAGRNDGTESNCSEAGNSHANWCCVGGLLGWNNGTASDCCATGNARGDQGGVGGIEGIIMALYSTAIQPVTLMETFLSAGSPEEMEAC